MFSDTLILIPVRNLHKFLSSKWFLLYWSMRRRTIIVRSMVENDGHLANQPIYSASTGYCRLLAYVSASERLSFVKKTASFYIQMRIPEGFCKAVYIQNCWKGYLPNAVRVQRELCIITLSRITFLRHQLKMIQATGAFHRRLIARPLGSLLARSLVKEQISLQ